MTGLYVFCPLTDLPWLVLIAWQSSKKSGKVKGTLRPRKRTSTQSLPLHSTVQRKAYGKGKDTRKGRKLRTVYNPPTTLREDLGFNLEQQKANRNNLGIPGKRLVRIKVKGF